MKLFQNKVFLILGAFILGGICTYFIGDYIRLKNLSNSASSVSMKSKNQDTRPFDLKNNQNQADPFAQMDIIHDQMRKKMDKVFSGSSMFGGSLLGNSFFDTNSLGDISSDGIKVEEHEDDDFKYVEIIASDIDKDSLNISIANGMISISGEIKKEEKNQRQNGQSMSSFVSKFSRSFNIPHGVSEENVKIDTEDNKIIIKFRKDKI